MGVSELMTLIIFLCVGSVIIYLWDMKGRKTLNIRRFYFLDYLESWPYGSNKCYKSYVCSLLDDCKRLGLLSEDDLYLDLTGGEKSADILSDEQMFSLRMHQNCGNGSRNRSATNLVFDEMRFDPYKHMDLSGGWSEYEWGSCIDKHVGWGNTESEWVREHATLRGVFLDSGSGNRIRGEWKRKLNKISWACDEVERRKLEGKTNQINKKLEELAWKS